MGKISFGSDVPKDLAEKAAGMLNGASTGGRLVGEESDLLRHARKMHAYKESREKEKHDALVRQSEKIKERNRAKRYPGLSEEEIRKLEQEEQEERKRLEQEKQEEKKRLEQEKASKPSHISPDENASRDVPTGPLPQREKRRQDEYEKWLRKRKEALGQIEYGEDLRDADWMHGTEYIDVARKKAEDANWHLANLFLGIAKGKDEDFVASNKPFPDWEDYVIKHFGNLKDGLFKPKGEEASPESESPDSGKGSPKKEGGKKRKMKTVRKHSLGGDDKDGKKE